MCLQRKAAEVDEAPEDKAAAEEAPAAEEPAAKRRAVAKGKKPVQALQPVEHRSHQKVSSHAAADWSYPGLTDNMVPCSAYLIPDQPHLQLQIEDCHLVLAVTEQMHGASA